MNIKGIKKSTIFAVIIFVIIVGVGVYFAKNDRFNSYTRDFIFSVSGTKVIKVYFVPIKSEIEPFSFDLENGAGEYWENRENVDFVIVNSSEEADVIIRWIKEYADDTLGYAFEGKFVEVGFGDSKCDGAWYPYDAFTTEQVLIHELGHVLGKEHSNNPKDIMYYSLPKTYYFNVGRNIVYKGRQIGGYVYASCRDIIEIKREKDRVMGGILQD